MRKVSYCAAAVILLAASVPTASGQKIRIEVENLQPSDGFYLTPFWFGLHDGSFDLFNSGEAASGPLEALAEDGDADPLRTLFASATNGDGSARQDGVVLAPGGFGGAPVFDPGEVEVFDVEVVNPTASRYFSFASMVIPSNDAFVGNGNPTMWQVFAPDGSFAGPLTINLTGAQIYDAGTESNTGTGAAFSLLANTPTDEGGVVSPHAGLDNFVGTAIPAGTPINSGIAPTEPLARITITAIPEPASLLLLAPLALVSFRLRSRP